MSIELRNAPSDPCGKSQPENKTSPVGSVANPTRASNNSNSQRYPTTGKPTSTVASKTPIAPRADSQPVARAEVFVVLLILSPKGRLSPRRSTGALTTRQTRQLQLAIQHLPPCVILNKFPPVGFLPIGPLAKQHVVSYAFCADISVRCSMNAKPRRNCWSFLAFLSISPFILVGVTQVLPQSHLLRSLGPVSPKSRLSKLRATPAPVIQRTPPLAGVNAIQSVAVSSSLPLKPSVPATNHLLQGHILFERNDGQADSQVLYLSHGSGYTLFLTRTGATIVLPEMPTKGPGVTARRASFFRLRFGGANPRTDVSGLETLPGTSNYFSGSDPKLWHTRIPQFAKVRYSNLYPGVDLTFYFREGQLEYDVIASPGADLSAVNLQIEGANPSLTREGDVSIKMGANELVRLPKPYAYQSGAAATVVPTNYSLHYGRMSFALGDYDRSRPLVIDPALIFATVVTSNCGTCTDVISDMAADNTGVYLTGSTNAAIFPATASGPASSDPHVTQTFVVKLDPTGSQVLYSTFLSSSSGQSITVDTLGSAYVSGNAYFGTPPFPLTTGVFSGSVPPNASGLGAAYAAKLSPDGSTISYSTFLQQPTSNGAPAANAQVVNPAKIAVDSTGALYITGTAIPNPYNEYSSIRMPLPVTVGAFQTTPGADFVLKLNPNASGFDYATYIDGTSNADPYVAGVAVDSSGDAFVAGSATVTGFPTTSGAYQTSSGGAFVMELNPNGTAQVYSTFFVADSQAFGLAVDSQGQAVITGDSSGTLPVTSNAFCGNISSGSYTGFVTKFKADGSGLIYTTTLCGGDPQGASVAVDSTGAAYVLGIAATPADFQPFLLQPIQGYVPTGLGAPDIANIAVKLDTSGNLQWSTFLGQKHLGHRRGRRTTAQNSCRR